MKKIICRKCGSEIDASLGECPVCGAVYYILSDSGETEPETGNQPGKAPEAPDSGGTHTWTIDDILNESTAEFGLDTSTSKETSQQSPIQNGYTPAQRDPYAGQNDWYAQGDPQYTQPSSQYTQQNSQRDDQYAQRRPQQRDSQYTQQNGQNPQYTQNPRGNQQNRNPQQRDARYPQQGNQRQDPRYANQSNQNGQRPRQQGGQRPQQNQRQGQRPQQNPRQGQRTGQNQQRSRRELMDDDTAYYGQERRGGLSDRTKMLIVGAAAALALLTVIIFIMSGVFSFGKDDGETQYMPDLVGLTESSARNILESYDLSLKISTTYEDSSEEKDTVIDQSVKKGKKLVKKDSIVLVLSNGRGEEEPEETDKPTDEPEDEKIKVPDLSDMTYQEAERELERLGLKISKTSGVYSDTVAEDRVVNQSPVKGGELKKGGTVIVTLSKGVQPTEPPKNHIITVTAGKGGSISPKGQVEVKDGGSQSFSIIPDSGYEIREVKVDGTNVGAVESYTFTNVTGDHSIYAVFQTATTPTPTPTPTPPPTEPPPPPTEPVGEPDNPAND